MISTIKWGILSTAKIARLHVIPGMQQSEHGELYAIASRDLARAQQVASDYAIPQAHGSYEDLLADPEVQAVYIPLPNHLHVPWSMKAAEAGKHVLCEKPLALNADEAAKLVTFCNDKGVVFMEAFMYRMHPQWQLAKQYVQDGKIGDLKAIQAFFSYTNLAPDNIRNRSDIEGGGGLMDIGCYPISVSRFIFDAEPQRVSALVTRHPEWKVDILTSGMMAFERGHAAFTCATQLTPYQRVNIFGATGRLELEIPFNAPEDRPTKLYYETETGVKTITIETCHQYQAEIDLFSKAILDGTAPPTPPEDAIANMKVIDAMFRAGESGQWEPV